MYFSPGPEVIKLFVLNSAEHEILNAKKYKISRYSAFKGQICLDAIFLLINVKMPIIIGVLTFMSRKNFMLNCVEHENGFITSDPEFPRILFRTSIYCQNVIFLKLGGTKFGLIMIYKPQFCIEYEKCN